VRHFAIKRAIEEERAAFFEGAILSLFLYVYAGLMRHLSLVSLTERAPAP
jgi:hypothetical protein